MQQLPGPAPVAPPTFSELVLGGMLGLFGCFLASMLLTVCMVVVLTSLGLAIALPRLPQNPVIP